MSRMQVIIKKKFDFIPTEFDGLFIVKYEKFNDNRGGLIKYLQSDVGFFDKFTIDDIYTTSSKKNVVRGMHHQIEKFGQCKYISCLNGEFWDIAIDLRRDSKTYKEVFTYKLNSKNLTSLIIPSGFSHGTYSMQDDTLMLSVCSGKYLPEKESGILMSSLGLPFFSCKDAIVSDKDKSLTKIQDF